MAYQDYLVEIKKEDFNALKKYREDDNEQLLHDFIPEENRINIQNLCYGPKINIILNLGSWGHDFKWKRSIPQGHAFANLDANSFQVLDKKMMKTLIKAYKEDCKIQLCEKIELKKKKAEQNLSDNPASLKELLNYEYKRAASKAESELEELDYLFNINKLESASNKALKPLVDTSRMRDELFNLFYIYKHFDWNTSYMILASW